MSLHSSARTQDSQQCQTKSTVSVGDSLRLDQNIVKAFPVQGSEVVNTTTQNQSILGRTVKVSVKLPTGGEEDYFLKIVTIGVNARAACKGEYESLKAIFNVCPGFAPAPHGWGKCEEDGSEAYFLLEEFVQIGAQPADPISLTRQLATLHLKSQSPTGRFGFHVKTCHGHVVQEVDHWDNSWALVFGRHLGHFINLAKPVFDCVQFDVLCNLILKKVVPRLLLPLQENGRVLKPCLIHGDCWDGNTANLKYCHPGETVQAVVYDACSFYGHNEYDIGNWRAQRHKLSDEAYIRNYKAVFPPSEPTEEWDSRNRLYSLTFNIGNAVYIPGSTQHQTVFDDMLFLCKEYCTEELSKACASSTLNILT